MKNQTYLLLIATILLISACRKSETPDDKTYIRGHLLEYGTEAPLANVKIYLGNCEGGLLEPLYCSTIDSFYTNENGYFDYETDAQSVDVCSFESVDGYYPIGNYVINRGVNEFTQYADPEAWLELHVKNVTPADNNDKIRFGHEYGPSGWEELLGSNVDETILWRIKGNYYSYLIWKVTKNATTIEYRDTFSVTAHDTTYYEILY